MHNNYKMYNIVGASLSKQLPWLHAEMMSWIAECRLSTTLTWCDLQPGMYNFVRLQVVCRWWSVRRYSDKGEVRYRGYLSRIRYGCQCCTLAVAQHWPLQPSARGRSIFGKYLNAHLKFTVYGRKQASMYVNTLPQCSLASVGLAQARPNKYNVWPETKKSD